MVRYCLFKKWGTGQYLLSSVLCASLLIVFLQSLLSKHHQTISEVFPVKYNASCYL
jgi:hypothetical protein